jgi:hypothetical protein
MAIINERERERVDPQFAEQEILKKIFRSNKIANRKRNVG